PGAARSSARAHHERGRRVHRGGGRRLHHRAAGLPDAPGFAPVGKILRDADSAFGNFEGTAIDLSRTPAVPQAEFGGVWIIGAPAVAKDLKSIGFDIMSR